MLSGVVPGLKRPTSKQRCGVQLWSCGRFVAPQPRPKQLDFEKVSGGTQCSCKLFGSSLRFSSFAMAAPCAHCVELQLEILRLKDLLETYRGKEIARRAVKRQTRRRGNLKALVHFLFFSLRYLFLLLSVLFFSYFLVLFFSLVPLLFFLSFLSFLSLSCSAFSFRFFAPLGFSLLFFCSFLFFLSLSFLSLRPGPCRRLRPSPV